MTRASTFAHLETGTVAAYLDNGLSPEGKAEVEAHLADCETCRAEIVQIEGSVRPRGMSRRALLSGIGVAAAAAVLIALLPGRADFPGGAGDPARTESLALAVRALGAAAQPPVYLGVEVRAPSANGADLFREGMRAYGGAKYADAVSALHGARDAGIEGAATPFFLGASLLMLDDAPGAAQEFARVIDMGETPYLGEAHYFKAKAHLRLNQPSLADVELDRAVRSALDPMKSAARSLKDSLRVLRGR